MAKYRFYLYKTHVAMMGILRESPFSTAGGASGFPAQASSVSRTTSRMSGNARMASMS